MSLIVAAVIAVAALLMALSWKLSGLILDPVVLPSVNWPDMFGLKYERVHWKSEDGALIYGWWIAAADSVASDKTIVCCHGWGTNSGDILHQTWYLAHEGFNLLYFDFRGCGESPRFGHTSLGWHEIKDLRSAFQWLEGAKRASCRKVGIYGLSMGAVVALMAAARPDYRIEAVAAEAPYISFGAAIGRYIKFHFGVPKFPFFYLYLWTLYLRTGWADHEGVSPRFTAGRFQARRLLLLYGDQDYLAPDADGREIDRLVRSAGRGESELWICPGAGHTECFDREPALYRRKIVEFFKKSLES